MDSNFSISEVKHVKQDIFHSPDSPNAGVGRVQKLFKESLMVSSDYQARVAAQRILYYPHYIHIHVCGRTYTRCQTHTYITDLPSFVHINYFFHTKTSMRSFYHYQ